MEAQRSGESLTVERMSAAPREYGLHGEDERMAKGW